MFVDPAWMRRGVGRALMADAIAAAKEVGASRIEVTGNVHAGAFYEAIGFVTHGVADTAFGPAPRRRLDLATG